VITFLATRPISSAGLVKAKYQMAVASALLTWALVIIGMTFWILVTGNLDNARELAQTVFARFTRTQGFTIVVATAVLLAAVTCRQLTDFFPLLLTGRRWIIETSASAGAAIVVGLVCGASWLVAHQEALSRFYAALPWLAASLAVVKSSVAIGAFGAAVRWGLLRWRSVANVVLMWLGLSAAGIGLAILAAPSGALGTSMPVIVITIAAFMPLCRFPLAILAVDWNRHR
jgi:hypothetical protein